MRKVAIFAAALLLIGPGLALIFRSDFSANFQASMSGFGLVVVGIGIALVAILWRTKG
jgi:hypothetical protein